MAASRREQIEKMLAASPDDAFLLYGLAMEFIKEGNESEGVHRLKTLVNANPNYTAAYQQLGQILSQAGETDEAKQWLERGVAVASGSGDSHAAGEMQQLLMMM